MHRLRVLLPGCSVEKALDAKKQICEQISAQMADMTETTTTLIATHRAQSAEECCEYDIPRRRASDRR